MFTKKVKGFTLIELLVVIAIIGILSSIVLVSVNSARDKAKAAAIKSNIEGARVAAELFYDTGSTYAAVCTSADFNRITAAVTAQGQTAVCANNATAWCLKSPVPPSGNYCSDSTGYAGNVSTGCANAANAQCN